MAMHPRLGDRTNCVGMFREKGHDVVVNSMRLRWAFHGGTGGYGSIAWRFEGKNITMNRCTVEAPNDITRV
jgi:hypothetical protein